MSTLVLRLAGPLQSWGSASRFTRRNTESFPTKSGVVGLLASALGRRRDEPVDDLTHLRMAVRMDQGGTMLRDFHTAHHQLSGASMPLTERYYLADAVFTAFLGGPHAQIETLRRAVEHPAHPLFLGRRSCVPSGRVLLGVTEEDPEHACATWEWQAGRDGRRRERGSSVTVPVQADAGVFPSVPANREISDVPLSFNPEHRRYASRMVASTTVDLPTGQPEHGQEHDPMALLEELP